MFEPVGEFFSECLVGNASSSGFGDQRNPVNHNGNVSTTRTGYGEAVSLFHPEVSLGQFDPIPAWRMPGLAFACIGSVAKFLKLLPKLFAHGIPRTNIRWLSNYSLFLSALASMRRKNLCDVVSNNLGTLPQIARLQHVLHLG